LGLLGMWLSHPEHGSRAPRERFKACRRSGWKPPRHALFTPKTGQCRLFAALGLPSRARKGDTGVHPGGDRCMQIPSIL